MRRTGLVLGVIAAFGVCTLAMAATAGPRLAEQPAPSSLVKIAAANLKPTPFDTEVIPAGPITLTWSQVAPPDVVRYDVYFGPDESAKLVGTNQKNTQWTIEEPLPPGRYYWRVVVRSAEGDEWPGPLCWFSVPHWIQAAVDGTDVQWIIQHPGTYAASASSIAVRSNSLVSMHMESSGDLASANGEEIGICYAIGDHLQEAEEEGWMPAETLSGYSIPIPPVVTGDGWGTQHLNLWQKLIVTKSTPTGEYENAVLITFCGEP